ncbi:MAG: M1 family metallopeptidase [Bacteroidales bacterium]|nr:M1 family metallopeptidase [Bacteroidales bacterium]
MKYYILIIPIVYSLQSYTQHEPVEKLQIDDIEKHFNCSHFQPDTGGGDKSVINPNPYVFDYDVKYYKLDLEAYDTTNQFSGNATVKAVVTATEMDTFSIELSNKLVVDSVFFDGIKLSATHQSNNIYVELASPLPSGSLFTFRLYYHTPPGYSSTYYSSTQSPSYGNFPVSQTLSEPYFAHEFMPCKQELEDKADSVSVFITTDTSLMAAGPGLLKTVNLPEGKRRYEWRTQIPTAYYLIFFAVSDYQDYQVYAKPDSLINDSILIENFVYDYPNCLEANKAAIDNTANMIELLSNLYGLFPFHEEKYGHYLWSPGTFSGMEHITMSGMRYLNTYLISHELGHSWFGDNVTCATWSDIWINEGFATYTEYLVLEYLYSKASADAKMKIYMDDVMAQPDGSVYVPEENLNSVGRIFSPRLSYRKGGALVHMIRFQMNNDSLFFRTMYEFQQQYKGGSATGMDFKNICEQVSGLDFTDFFNQWYFGEGFPIFSAGWSQEADTVTLHLEQSTSTTITPLFKTPIEIKLNWQSNDTTIRVWQNQYDTTYRFTIPYEITDIELDPNNWILNQVESINHLKNVDIKVYLQGPFNSSSGLMNIKLNPGYIPVDQPFGQEPWNYTGIEHLETIPPDMVDWLLIEMRDTTTADLASQESVISRQAAILLEDGTVRQPDGKSYMQFVEAVSQNLFVSIYHRNHLGIISSEPVVYVKGVYRVDFTTSISKVLGEANGYSQLEENVFGMTAGDADANGEINTTDKTDTWELEAGESGYFQADLNLDAQTDNEDKDDFWLPAQDKSSQIPE